MALVLSTLAIAALFTPLRRRIQELIDRRFFRRKYDASQALARLDGLARSQVDSQRLTASLLEIVSESLQPQTMGLWLKEHTPKEDRL
jgi:hypothetical protein